MTDPWHEAGFDGARRAQARRVASWTPQERLDWLEAALLDAARTGVLAAMRERKQRRLLASWSSTDGHDAPL